MKGILSETKPASPVVRYTRAIVIRALHNLCHPDASEAENERLYGDCYRLHGHDYRVEVTIEAKIDPRTGLCRFRDQLDDLLKKELIEPFDGRSLNSVYANTSGEALAHLWFDRLRPFIPAEIGLSLAIQETRKNRFERRDSPKPI